MTANPDERYARARASLDGLSVGDAFGERFFVSPDIVDHLIENRAVPAGDWRYGDVEAPVWLFTDDTAMALSIVSSLRQFGAIDQDWLAESFALRYHPFRGYGPAMHGYLAQLREGADWRSAAPALFDGRGSFGNGSAMRVAPLGAYFADDLDAAAEQARLSAEVTHAHPEAIAGAIAVAVAAAWAWRARAETPLPTRPAFLDRVMASVPDSLVRAKLRQARDLPDCSVRHAAEVLGNGSGVSAQDTVPFTLWCAATYLGDFEEALWVTLSALGDRDTTCAIVGGIVAAHTGTEGIPIEWLQTREPLPDWPFQENIP